MIPHEWIAKIREIELRTVDLVQDLMAGQYHSVFKGRGIDFTEVREYQPGDEVRRIDWNVTARTGVTHIKKYIEEREMTVMVLVDASASGNIGSVEVSKRELAAELTAVLAFSAIRNNDNVGLLLFTDGAEKYVPAGKGRRHVLRLISEVLAYRPDKRGTNIAAALQHINRAISRRCVVFVISDFLDEGFERALRVTSRKHDVVAIPIMDPSELALPNAGWVVFEDVETGDLVELNTASPKVRTAFAAGVAERNAALRRLFQSIGLDAIEVQTDRPYLHALLQFFERRYRRLHP